MQLSMQICSGSFQRLAQKGMHIPLLAWELGLAIFALCNPLSVVEVVLGMLTPVVLFVLIQCLPHEATAACSQSDGSLPAKPQADSSDHRFLQYGFHMGLALLAALLVVQGGLAVEACAVILTAAFGYCLLKPHNKFVHMFFQSAKGDKLLKQKLVEADDDDSSANENDSDGDNSSHHDVKEVVDHKANKAGNLSEEETQESSNSTQSDDAGEVHGAAAVTNMADGERGLQAGHAATCQRADHVQSARFVEQVFLDVRGGILRANPEDRGIEDSCHASVEGCPGNPSDNVNEDGEKDADTAAASIVAEVRSKMSWADLEEDDEHMARRLADNVPDQVYGKTPTNEATEEQEVGVQKSVSLISGRWSDELSDEDDWDHSVPSGPDNAKNLDAEPEAEGRGRAQDTRRKRGSKEEMPTMKYWAAKIRACGRSNDIDGAMDALEQATRCGQADATELQNALLDALLTCGSPERAMDLFKEMKDARKADVVTFNIVLRHYLSKNKRGEAKQLLAEMNDHGITASKVTFNELLTDRVKVGDRAGMWRVIEKMRDEGLGVNKVACAICLKTLTDSTPHDEVKRTLSLLKEVNEPIDEVLLTSAIEASIRIKDLSLIPHLLNHLDKCAANGTRTTLTPATYGSMIKAHGQARDLKHVWAAWDSMFRNSVVPSSVTLGCMVEALVTNGAATEAWKLVREMLEQDTYRDLVNTVIYSTLLKGFSHTNEIDRCFEILKEMHERGIAANTITYNTVLDVCAKSSAMERVPEVFQEMKAHNVEPDIITYSTLIKGYCLVGDLDCAFQFMDEMKRDGRMQLDEVVYNSLLDGCGRQHQVQKATEVLKDMLDSGVTPSNYTLSILVRLLGRTRRLNDAFDLLEEFRSAYGVKPNVQVCTCLISACLQNKQFNRAMRFLETMLSEYQCKPDAKCYTVILGGCSQSGHLEEAIQIARFALRLPYASGPLALPDAFVRGPPVVLESKSIRDLDAKIRNARLRQELTEDWREVLDSSEGHRGGAYGGNGNSGGWQTNAGGRNFRRGGGGGNADRVDQKWRQGGHRSNGQRNRDYQ